MNTEVLKSYHADPALTTDGVCLEVVRLGLVRVDFEAGTITTTRRSWKGNIGGGNRHGYQVVTLHLNGIRKQVKVHRLIWIAANGVPAIGLVIDHINRNKADNRLVNLRLVDSKANAHNRRRYHGTENPAVKIDAGVAASIRRSYRTVKSYRTVAREYGVSASLVAQILRGERWAS